MALREDGQLPPFFSDHRRLKAATDGADVVNEKDIDEEENEERMAAGDDAIVRFGDVVREANAADAVVAVDDPDAGDDDSAAKTGNGVANAPLRHHRKLKDTSILTTLRSMKSVDGDSNLIAGVEEGNRKLIAKEGERRVAENTVLFGSLSKPPKKKGKDVVSRSGYVAFNPDGSALVLVKPPPLAVIQRLQKIQTVSEISAIVSEDFGDVIFNIIVAAALLSTAYFFLRKVAARTGIPEVLLFLFSGVLLRLASTPISAAKFDLIAKPFVRMALTAMGLQIGSHLNRSVLEPLLKPLIRFSVVFVPVVITLSAVVAAILFPSPEVAPFALLVGAIALERSSPEALIGIANAKAAGPFTNSTMAIAALQDVFALVAFVIFGAVVGYPFATAVAHLSELAVGTIVATGITILGVRAAVAFPAVANLFSVFGSGEVGIPLASGVNANNAAAGGGGVVSSTVGVVSVSIPSPSVADEDGGDPPSTPTQKAESPAMRARRVLLLRVLLAFLVLVTPLVSWFVHVELLLAAVIAGAVLNWDQHHRLTTALDAHSTISNIFLFCLLGHRINILAYLQNLPAACVLFAARLVGLWLGAWGGGLVAPLHADESTRWHNKSRWMGLVTQLAIALSLVDRMEEDFPQAASMARACGGSVIGGLLLGPSLLQFVLKSVGEAGRATAGGGGGHHQPQPSPVQTSAVTPSTLSLAPSITTTTSRPVKGADAAEL